MSTRLLKMLDTMRVVRQETRIWVHHLTGEGPTTVRRQREVVAQVLAATPPLVSLAGRATTSERLVRLEVPAMAATPGGRPVLTTR